MGMSGLLICDLCQRYIAAAEKNKVSFGNQDFHFSCYQGQLQVLSAQQAALARQRSWRESDWTISMSRVLGS
jgi:hypothetical protein